jgi:hypothetical protein
MRGLPHAKLSYGRSNARRAHHYGKASMAHRLTGKDACLDYASGTVPPIEAVGERPGARWQLLIDFDGTIAPDDPTDHLFERFADPYWRILEDDWQSGRISSRECMQRQVDLLRVWRSAPSVSIRVSTHS